MPTRNVVITDQQSQMIDDLVASGKYQNASEVLREGLRLIETRRQRETDYSAWLRREVQIGIDAADRGEVIVLDSDEAVEAFVDNLFDEVLNEESVRA